MGDSCGSGGCGCGNNEGGGCCEDDHGHGDMKEMDMAGILMGLSNEAWSELMIDKMKAALEKQKGAKMNKAATIVVEAASKHWEKKMMDKAEWAEFEEKLRNAMK